MERKRGRAAGGAGWRWCTPGHGRASPRGHGYLETTSTLDGAPVRIAVPDDPDGEGGAKPRP